MSNPNNNFTIVGRAAAAPKKFAANSDGSYGVALAVYADNSYKSKDGSRKSEVIQLDAYVPAQLAGGKVVFDYINKGDLIAVSGHMATDVFTKNGETVYKPVNRVDRISLHSTRKEQAARGVQPQAQATPAQAAAPAQAPVQNQTPATAPAAQPAPQAQAQQQVFMGTDGNFYDAAGNLISMGQ